MKTSIIILPELWSFFRKTSQFSKTGKSAPPKTIHNSGRNSENLDRIGNNGDKLMFIRQNWGNGHPKVGTMGIN